MNRSNVIYGRAARNLARENIIAGVDFVNNELYDAIREGQDKILVDHPMETRVDITLASGTSEYNLQAEDALDLHDHENAASEQDEANTTTGWTAALNCSLATSNTERTDSDGEYAIRATVSGAAPQIKVTDLDIDDNQYHQLDFWIRGNGSSSISLYMSNDDGDVISEVEIIPVTTEWTNIAKYLYPTAEGTKIIINLGSNTNGDWFDFDDFVLTTSDPNKLRHNAIKEIKAVYVPSTWSANLIEKPVKEWEDVVNTSVTSNQPLYYVRFGDVIRLHPAPTAAETLTFVVKNHGALSALNENTAPEIPSLFDYALELFATAQFSNERDYWLRLFYEEAERAATANSRKWKPLAPKADW